FSLFLFISTPTSEFYTLSLHDALPILVLLSIFPLGCKDDFLERPPQDAYVVDEWFQTEEQIALAANALYGGVWFDYQRSFLNIGDRKSTRLNSSHVKISYAVFCLKKKK